MEGGPQVTNDDTPSPHPDLHLALIRAEVGHDDRRHHVFDGDSNAGFF